jgi:hypothetical protein
MAKKSPRGAECGARFIVTMGGVTVGFPTVRFTRESEKALGDCHTGEEEEEAGCKPEFEAKVLLGNLRLWRPRVASWNLLCMHHRPPAQQMQYMVAVTKDRPSLATYAICLMYINCPRVCPARNVNHQQLSHISLVIPAPPVPRPYPPLPKAPSVLMYPTEIVIKEMERDRVRMVFHFFAE